MTDKNKPIVVGQLAPIDESLPVEVIAVELARRINDVDDERGVTAEPAGTEQGRPVFKLRDGQFQSTIDYVFADGHSVGDNGISDPSLGLTSLNGFTNDCMCAGCIEFINGLVATGEIEIRPIATKRS